MFETKIVWFQEGHHMAVKTFYPVDALRIFGVKHGICLSATTYF